MTPQEWEQIDNFEPDEVRCPCCGQGPEHMDFDTILFADRARSEAGIIFDVTSGYRCPDHNAEVGGVDKSSHRGYALDIACEGSRSRHKIVNALRNNGFNRIGIASDFVHADMDPDKPINVIWVY